MIISARYHISGTFHTYICTYVRYCRHLISGILYPIRAYVHTQCIEATANTPNRNNNFVGWTLSGSPFQGRSARKKEGCLGRISAEIIKKKKTVLSAHWLDKKELGPLNKHAFSAVSAKLKKHRLALLSLSLVRLSLRTKPAFFRLKKHKIGSVEVLPKFEN